MEAEDLRASFLFVFNINGHHQEWLGSMTTNSHGVAAFDFATMSGCDQLVVSPTHARGGALDLLMTDVPDLDGLLLFHKVIAVCNKDKPSLDDQCRRAFSLNQEAHLLWTPDRSQDNWEDFVRCQVRTNETYSEAMHLFSDRNGDVLMNVQSPHKWWSTLKFAVFGSSSSLFCLLVGVVGW